MVMYLVNIIKKLDSNMGKCSSWVWWVTPVIPALRRLRQEDPEFESSLGYVASSRPTWDT
jgi:hypothetical protein